MSFIIRIVVNAIALWATAYLLPGMTVSGSIVNLLVLGAVFPLILIGVAMFPLILTGAVAANPLVVVVTDGFVG